jgi:hypothetical protein
MEHLLVEIQKNFGHCDLTNPNEIEKMSLQIQEKCKLFMKNPPKFNISERSLLQDMCNKLWHTSEQANLKQLPELKLEGKASFDFHMFSFSFFIFTCNV